MINKVICGDSIEEMNKMQPNSVDLIFADKDLQWKNFQDMMSELTELRQN